MTLKVTMAKVCVCVLTRYDVVHQGRRHAEDADQKVADGEVQNKQVGDGAHVPAAHHDETHHAVPHHAHQEDEQVGDGEDCSHGRLVEVEVHVGDVLTGRRAFLQPEQVGRVGAARGGVGRWLHGSGLDG